MLKHDRILALDIGTSGIKLAEYVPGKDGAAELVNFAVGSLGLAPSEEGDRFRYLTLTLKEMMKERHIRPGPVLLSVSGQQVFSRFVKLPPVDKDKIAQIVAYEAQQNVPFPIEEVVWDYQLIGTGENELDVMLAAIKGEIIESLTGAVENAGLLPDLVDVAPMALYNAARFNGVDSVGSTLLLDLGARSTDLVFLEAGRVFIRSIPVAGNTISQNIMREMEVSFEEAEDLKIEHAFVGLGGAYDAHEDEIKDRVSKITRNVMTRMHAEINRSISFYRGQQSGTQPVQVLLAGGTSVIPGTDGFFKEKLKIPVDYFNPFENVAVSDSVDGDYITENVNVMGQTVGLALRRLLTCPIEINLMPSRVLADKEMRKRRPIFVMAGVGLILTLLVWCGFFFKMSQLAAERYEIVNRKVTSLDSVQRNINGVQGELNGVLEQAGTIQAVFHKRTQWNEILTEIRSKVPDGIWLVEIRRLDEAPDASGRSGMSSMDEMGFEGFGGFDEPTAEAEEEEGDGLPRIEISGYGYIDKVPDWSKVNQFVADMRASPLFSEETAQSWLPEPRGETREFKIEVVLAESLDL